MQGKGLVGAGASGAAALADAEGRYAAVGCRPPGDEVTTARCGGAELNAARALLERNGYPRRLSRQRFLADDETPLFQLGRPCRACDGAVARTGGPAGNCERCEATGFEIEAVDAREENDVAAAIAIGWEPGPDPGRTAGRRVEHGQPVLPACPDCGGSLVWREEEYVPGTRACTRCGSLFSDRARG